MREPLHERAAGRWRGILPALGIGTPYLSGKHGPCPMCQGKDRWRFADRDGSGDWHCNVCGHGTGTDLAMKFLGVDFKTAAQRIEAVIGAAPKDPPKQRRPEKTLREAMRRLWGLGRPLSAVSPAGVYMAARGLSLPSTPMLRMVDTTKHVESGRNLPAIVAKVVSPDGSCAVQLHRLYLELDGRKADVEPCRKLMEGDLPAGAAVRLTQAAEHMGVAEGIETAVAATQLFGIPTWAAITAGGMEKFAPPPECRTLMIFGDNDEGCAGQAAAFVLAKRLHGKVKTAVRIPEKVGMDWNDVLLEGKR